jgi:prevent-host-death family protein
MSQSIMSLSDFKADASRLLNRIQEEPGVLVLTQNGRARAVVQDYDQYRAEQEGLLMLKLLVQGEADLTQGRLSPQSEVFADLRKRLNSLGSSDA